MGKWAQKVRAKSSIPLLAAWARSSSIHPKKSDDHRPQYGTLRFSLSSLLPAASLPSESRHRRQCERTFHTLSLISEYLRDTIAGPLMCNALYELQTHLQEAGSSAEEERAALTRTEHACWETERQNTKDVSWMPSQKQVQFPRDYCILFKKYSHFSWLHVSIKKRNVITCGSMLSYLTSRGFSFSPVLCPSSDWSQHNDCISV